MTTDEKQGRAASWLLLSVLVVLADQASKYYITQHFGEFEHISVLPVLDITRPHPAGACHRFHTLSLGSSVFSCI
jgi:lipoprotein signal peptidase